MVLRGGWGVGGWELGSGLWFGPGQVTDCVFKSPRLCVLLCCGVLCTQICPSRPAALWNSSSAQFNSHLSPAPVPSRPSDAGVIPPVGMSDMSRAAGTRADQAPLRWE